MNMAKVLVVDDDKDILKMVQVTLSRAGIDSDTALSAEEGLEKMRTRLYAVVVSDIHMPGMTGVEMVTALKQMSPLVQIIMLTGDAKLPLVIDCIERGAVDFFSKGSAPELLVHAVTGAMERVVRWAGWIGSQSREVASFAAAAGTR